LTLADNDLTMVDRGCYHDLNWLTTIGESLKCLLYFLLAGIAGNGLAKVVIENQAWSLKQ
jgi:hypothetical protein